MDFGAFIKCVELEVDTVIKWILNSKVLLFVIFIYEYISVIDAREK